MRDIAKQNSAAARSAVGRFALCALGVAWFATVAGCSWIGSSPGNDPSPTDDPGRFSAALAEAKTAMGTAPDQPYWPYRAGELYASADSTSQAVTYLLAALFLDPGYAPAAALLSKVYYDSGAHEPAMVLLEDFLAQNPESPDALRAALALHLEALGYVERAEAVLDGCRGDTREVREARTFVTLRGDDLEAALVSAKQTLEENPKSAANHNNYGIALLYAGRPVEARKSFLKALELNDELPGALYNMAIVEAFYFFDEEKGRQWYARYRKYSSEDPDDLETLFVTDVTRLSESGEEK
jgi:tetratricopeptide (TPR) repeat protein